MNAPALIAAERVTVTAAGQVLVDAVSLAVHPREIVVLIGPNGSGKTTLLRALLGLMPASGRIDRKPDLRIGYVPQHFPRDPALPMTVDGFLALHARDSAARRAALARLEIAPLAGKQVSTLSGGEMARVQLARAIARKPDLLVLDEPFAGVDVTGEAALYRLLAALRDELGCGVILVSHDLHVVMAQASRVICLNRHICCEGEAAQVVRDPAFVQLFGERVAAELALYAHHHDHSHLPGGTVMEEPHG